MGVFGLIINVAGQPVDIKFTFDKNGQGSTSTDKLSEERFIQDTLVPKFNFQMIRPVILAPFDIGIRSTSYSLDEHP